MSEGTATTPPARTPVPLPPDRQAGGLADGRPPARPDGPPRWLSRIGRSGWMVVGFLLGVAATVAAVVVLAPFLTPLIIAVVIASALEPLVAAASRRGVRRGLAAALSVLAIPTAIALIAVVVVRSLRGMGDDWDRAAGAAAQRVEADLGADPVTPLVNALDNGKVLAGLASVVLQGAATIVELLLGTLFAIYILFFLLKDGPRFGAGIAARMPLPPATTRRLLATGATGLRRYVIGTTLIGAVDGVVIGFGAWVLDMPLVVPIALVTFALAYVPYIGAWVSGAFTVIVALGSGGMDTALWILGVILAVQIVVEGLMRPFVFGMALKMHPLTVLAATIIGGLLGGVMGVALGAPFTSIALGWWRTVRSAREAPQPDPALPTP